MAAILCLSAPASATVSTLDFPGGGRALERLLEQVHKHKKVKVVVKRAGDDGGGSTSTTTTPSTVVQGTIQPR
jgi:hypothetical protein